MKFLRSRYVLIILLTIVVIEGAFRLGFYEPLVSPMSHSGRTIVLKRAMEYFGTENVNVITLGDSRAVQGLNNRLIKESASALGLEHVRMSMPGSNFLTFKTLTNWGLDEMSALRGIVLVISPANLDSLGQGPYELAKILPLRNEIPLGEVLRHVPFDRTDMRTYAAFSSVAGYREDIKNLLANPGARLKALKINNSADPQRFFNYSANTSTDLCAVATDKPKVCLDELDSRRGEIPAKAWNALNSLCRAAGRESKVSAPGETEDLLLQEWMGFLDRLSQRVKVMLVMLPDHSIYQEKLYAPNATWVSNKLLEDLRHKGDVEVLDLRSLIVEQENAECTYYMDAKHLNKSGNAVLTQALLPALDNFWGALISNKKHLD